MLRRQTCNPEIIGGVLVSNENVASCNKSNKHWDNFGPCLIGCT